MTGSTSPRPSRARHRHWVAAALCGAATFAVPAALSAATFLIVHTVYHPTCDPMENRLCSPDGSDTFALMGVAVAVIGVVWLVAAPLTAWALRLRWPPLFLVPLVVGCAIRLDFLYGRSVIETAVLGLAVTFVLTVALAVALNHSLRPTADGDPGSPA
ncbi:hypothetical protein [Salininema proteolyticum]|uniref:Uncharacterized protein n=1 Tax=Salininema proteolyticum TaxID=1607685 RepID=A0ABV8TZK9_9ACTN